MQSESHTLSHLSNCSGSAVQNQLSGAVAACAPFIIHHGEFARVPPPTLLSQNPLLPRSELALSLVRECGEFLVLSRHLDIGIGQLATFLRTLCISLRFRFAAMPFQIVLDVWFIGHAGRRPKALRY